MSAGRSGCIWTRWTIGRCPRLPLTLIYAPEDVAPFPYGEAYVDPEKMLYNELIKTVGGTSAYASVLIKDDFPLHVRSNHGVGILSSLFGARCKIVNDNMPWVEHMELGEVRKAVERGVPDLNQALGKRVVDTHHYYLDKLSRYPKCGRCVRITQPDLQGPFDIAHLLVGNDVFLGVFDYPELLHDLLAVITETYIAFKTMLDPLLTDRAGDDAVYLHGCIFGGKVLVKDDTAIINLSEEMYRTFSKTYNDRILEACGGGSLHYCGPSRTWAQEAIGGPWLRGVNFGNPEKQDLAMLHAYWRERRVPILLWGDSLCLERSDRAFLDDIRKAGIDTGMSLAIRVNDRREAEAALDGYRKLSET